MEIQVIESEKMEALQALANANVEVGKVRDTIAQLKVEETNYIAEREKKTLDRIQQILDESASTLKEAFANYGEIHDFAKAATQLAVFLAEAYKEFGELRDIFEQYVTTWEENMRNQEAKLDETKKLIQIDRTQLNLDREAVRRTEKKLLDDKRKIRDDRETLERAIARLKESRI